MSAPACPAGHPAACIATSPEGTSWCRWCEDIARVRAQCDEIERVAPIFGALRALGAEVLLDVYGIDVADPADAPLDRAVARWWRESAP